MEENAARFRLHPWVPASRCPPGRVASHDTWRALCDVHPRSQTRRVPEWAVGMCPTALCWTQYHGLWPGHTGLLGLEMKDTRPAVPDVPGPPQSVYARKQRGQKALLSGNLQRSDFRQTGGFVLLVDNSVAIYLDHLLFPEYFPVFSPSPTPILLERKGEEKHGLVVSHMLPDQGLNPEPRSAT